MANIIGDNGDNTLPGTGDDDTISGLGGNDTISGGDGNDTVDGGAGNDVMTGGAGVDLVSYASATSGVFVNLNTTTAQNTLGGGTDTITGFEGVIGSDFNDTLVATPAGSSLFGGLGDDSLVSIAGGNDILDGGAGADSVSYLFTSSGITVNLNTVGAQNTGGGGVDTLIGIEHVIGTAFADTITGDAHIN
ncbi:MAG: calcium-binding protein [Caulobacter sp.]